MIDLDLVKLTEIMNLTRGSSKTKIGLIDGPVAISHKDLETTNIREINKKQTACNRESSIACTHGTFIAGMLSGKKGSQASSICPGCTLLIYPIFSEESKGIMPSASPRVLGEAIFDCIDSGANIINLSVSLTHLAKDSGMLKDALDYAARKEVVIVAAAGNQGVIGSSIITHHKWVIPVVACNLKGIPIEQSNLGGSIGKHGLMAPGENITGIRADGDSITLGGTSIATPFVTGAIALLWSEFSNANANEIKFAISNIDRHKKSIVPPLLNAFSSYQFLKKGYI